MVKESCQASKATRTSKRCRGGDCDVGRPISAPRKVRGTPVAARWPFTSIAPPHTSHTSRLSIVRMSATFQNQTPSTLHAIHSAALRLYAAAFVPEVAEYWRCHSEATRGFMAGCPGDAAMWQGGSAAIRQCGIAAMRQ